MDSLFTFENLSMRGITEQVVNDIISGPGGNFIKALQVEKLEVA